MIEKHISLSEASRRSGVGRWAIKAWLKSDLGLRLPRVRRGAAVLVREKDVEYVLARRRDARNEMKRHSKATR